MLGDGVDHLVGIAVLDFLTTKSSHNLAVRRFRDREVGDHPRPQRAEGVSPLGAQPVTVRILQITSGNVIGNRETKDDFLSPLLWHILANPSDNDR